MRSEKQISVQKTRRPVLLRWAALAVLLASIALLFALPAFAQTKYVITDGDSVIVCMSNSTDPQVVIREAGLQLGESDTYTTNFNGGISEIHINRVQMISVLEGDQIYVVGSYGGTAADVLDQLDITLSPIDLLSCTPDTETYDGMTIEITRINHETTSYEEPIPYGSKFFEDPSLDPGEERILIPGEEGATRYVARITYENGVEIQRNVLSQETVVLPKDAVILRGVDRDAVRDIVPTYVQPPYKLAPEPGSADYVPPAPNTVPGTTLRYKEVLSYNATAYTCVGYTGKTFTGTTARVGTVAVDPRFIPLGTRMYIVSEDGEYVYGYGVAEDTGGVIKGEIVDLYFETWEDCCDFGRRDVKIYILE